MSGAGRSRALRTLRLLLELAGLAFAGLVGFYVVVLVLASGSATLAALAGGWLALAAALAALRGRLPSSARTQLDCALLALAPAALATFAAVRERWPIAGPRFDAHGWGRTGGEPNVLWLSWLHGALWLALALTLARRGRRTAPRGGPRR